MIPERKCFKQRLVFRKMVSCCSRIVQALPYYIKIKKCLFLWMACQYVSVWNVYDKMSTQSCSISGPLCFNSFSAYGSISVTLYIKKKCIIFFPLDKSTLKGSWCIETVMHALQVTYFFFPLLFADPHLFLFLAEFKIKVF